MKAKGRYDILMKDRTQFLDTALEASKLTLPYLIRGEEEYTKGARTLTQPWQSVGSKGVGALASKLMLALLPPQTSFFKLQVDDSKLGENDIPPETHTELDLSFAKIERMIMESIAASNDRVQVHQALRHLIVGGNALMFMSEKDGLKMYPLNRYVVQRDGNGNVIEIVTKEKIDKALVLEMGVKEPKPNYPSDEDHSGVDNEVDVYTHVTRVGTKFKWHQEVWDTKIPGTDGNAPLKTNPWLVLRFNVLDGEAYGRGRVEEYMGDLKSLEALSQALVEGSAAAAKVVFLVSPSSTTKAATLESAKNGAIIQGRPDDVGVIQVGKAMDFRTAAEMAGSLERRLSDAFLILSVRDSERTTAEEVRMTQMELEQQLGGLFSLLTVEFLKPYLSRKLAIAQKRGDIPTLPDMVRPIIVAGVNALGRGQDAQALSLFLTTLGQTLGPEALATYINQDEVIKRLATAQGIDILNLVKSMDEVQAQQQQAMEAQQQQVQSEQQINMLKTPMMDPSKNPQAMEMMNG